MVHRIRCALWLTAAAVVTVLAAGCSDSGTGSYSQDGSSAPGEQAAGAADSEQAASDDSASSAASPADGGSADENASDERSPTGLGEFMRSHIFETFPDLVTAHPMVAQDQVIRSCMARQGLRYVVRDWLAEEAASRAAQPDLLEPGEEPGPEMGYGMADALMTPLGPTGVYSPDPNDAFREGLSETERRAWQEQFNLCYQEALDKLSPPAAAVMAFNEITASLDEQIAADPRIAAAAAEWSSCMAERGHRYADEDAIYASLNDVFVTLMPRVNAAGGPNRIDDALQAEIDALMALEVEIATADFACKAPLERVRSEVRLEHEARFMRENSDRLDRWRRELPTVTLPPGTFGIVALDTAGFSGVFGRTVR